MANNKTNKHQWIVLDGDIDAEWIESMNTVMVRSATAAPPVYVRPVCLCCLCWGTRGLQRTNALWLQDDNKMLTLASNERIPLTNSMRLLLEINHMNHCSPATVSRGGVIFVNGGWKSMPMVH